MTEQQLSAGLRELVRDPEVPQRLDIAQGIAAGRRSARRRRIGTSLGAALGVCVIAGGAVLLMPTDQAIRTVTPAASTTASAPGHSNPFVRMLVVGYVPPGLTQQTYRISQVDQSFSAHKPSTEAGFLRGLGVWVLPPGGKVGGLTSPLKPTLPEVAGAPTRPVNGKPARCVDKACRSLLVEHSPGRWIEVSFNGDGDPATVTRKVAESVRLDGRERVRMPFTVAGVPRALKPQEVLVTTGAPGRSWEARISFSDSPDGFDPTEHIPRALSVAVYPDSARTGDGAKTPEPNTTVDGRPAARSTPAEAGDFLDVFDVDGMHVSIDAVHPDVAGMLGSDGTVGLFRQVTLVPGHRTLSGWTETLVR